MSDKYYRLVTFVVDICSYVLRIVFTENAKTDKNVKNGFTDIHSYMAAKQKEIENLVSTKVLSREQFKIIFPQTGKSSIRTWDTTLLSALLLGLHGPKVQSVKNHIYTFRDIRNRLLHIAGSADVSEDEFNDMWADLKHSALILAIHTKGPAFQVEIDQRITKLMTNFLPGLGDTLSVWYTNTDALNQLKADLKDVREKVNVLCESKRVLVLDKDNVACTHVSNQASTPPTDVDVGSLNDNFRTAIKKTLPEEFILNTDIAAISIKIRTNRRIIFSSCDVSLCLQTAFYVARKLGYDISRCALLSDPMHWNYIDSSITDLVLLENPFGETHYDQQKSNAMLDIYDSSHIANPTSLVVVMVSREEVLQHVLGHIKEGHPLREDIVELHKEDTCSDGPDLVADILKADNGRRVDQTEENLLSMTDSYLSHLQCNQPDVNLLEMAQRLLHEHKAVVVTGSDRHSIDSIMANLTRPYAGNTRLLLTDAEHLRYVNISRISVLIIDHIAGKYKYDDCKARKWFDILDMLFGRVQVGKLNVILTSELMSLLRCVRDLDDHPILQQAIVTDCAFSRTGKTEMDKRNLEKTTEEHSPCQLRQNPLSASQCKQSNQRPAPCSIVDTYLPNQTQNAILFGKMIVNGQCSDRDPEMLMSDIPTDNNVSVSDIAGLLYQKDPDGDTSLHTAIVLLNEDHAMDIISFANSYKQVCIQNNLYQTPLHLAVLTNQSKIVRKLMTSGSDISVRDKDGNTALHIACRDGLIDMVRPLVEPVRYREVLDCQYEIPYRRIPQNFALQNYEGMTCLHLAAYNGHLTIVDMLVNKDIDVNMREGKSGRTILHHSIISDDSVLLTRLLKLRQCGIHVCSYDGSTPIRLARLCGRESFVQTLLASGADSDSDVSDSDIEQGFTENSVLMPNAKNGSR